jgi:hypothetical protein
MWCQVPSHTGATKTAFVVAGGVTFRTRQPVNSELRCPETWRAGNKGAVVGRDTGSAVDTIREWWRRRVGW